VDNEEVDPYSPPPIPLITTAQARSHLTELVQYLEALSVSELPGGAKPNLNVVVARQQLQTLEQALTHNMQCISYSELYYRLVFTAGVFLSSVIAFLSFGLLRCYLSIIIYSNKYFYVINPCINPCSPSPVHLVQYPYGDPQSLSCISVF